MPRISAAKITASLIPHGAGILKLMMYLRLFALKIKVKKIKKEKK